MALLKVCPTYLMSFTFLIVGVYSKTGFVKDQSMDIVFPARNIQKIEDVPLGHLRPVGYQRSPDGKVREEKEPITPALFYRRYISTPRPVVMRGYLKDSPVIDAWSDDAELKQKFGLVNITITVKKERAKRAKRQMKFKKFLLDYMYENWYLSTTVPDEMMGEFQLPEVVSCGTFKDRLVETELWMSSGGTSSLVHSHSDHNIHCVLDGRKDVVVIENKYKEPFKFQETYPNSGEGFSPIDTEIVNMFEFEDIKNVPWHWATLLKGDCLFLPAGYLTQVRSWARGVSYTVQFAPSQDFDTDDCGDELKLKRRKKIQKGKNQASSKAKDSKKKTKDGKKKTKDNKTKDKGKKDSDEKDKTDSEEENIAEKEEDKAGKKLSLAEVKFLWAFTNGQRHLSDKSLTPTSLRRVLSLIIKDGDKLHIEQFTHFYEKALHMDPDRPNADEIFHIMTPADTRAYLTRDEVMSLPDKKLGHICEVFNNIHRIRHDEL